MIMFSLHSFSRSIGKTTFEVSVTSSGQRVRVWKEVLDRNDGSYLVRMRFYRTVENLEISIKYKGDHVAKSPYEIKGKSFFITSNLLLIFTSVL